MRAEILDGDGQVVNTIIAELDFLESVYPGRWREAPGLEPPVSEPPKPTAEELLALIEQLQQQVQQLQASS